MKCGRRLKACPSCGLGPLSMVTQALDNRVWLTPAHLTKQGRQGQAGSGTHHDCTAYPVGLVRGSGFNKFLSNTNSKTFPVQGFHSFLGYTVPTVHYSQIYSYFK